MSENSHPKVHAAQSERDRRHSRRQIESTLMPPCPQAG